MKAEPPDSGTKNTQATTFFDHYRAAGSAVGASPQQPSSTDADDASGVNTPLASSEVNEAEDVSAGRLPAEAKRALVNLMRSGSVIAAQKPKLFEHICRYEKLLHGHLSDLYLRLLLDQKAGVALIVQQEVSGDGDDEDIYTLIPRRTLTLYDTLLLLVLRKYYQEREATGEQKIIVDIEQIEAFLTPFLSLGNHAKSDRRKLSASLTRMTERKLLTTVRGEDSRYEITAVIRYVVNAEFLERLLGEYENLAKVNDPDTQAQSKDHA